MWRHGIGQQQTLQHEEAFVNRRIAVFLSLTSTAALTAALFRSTDVQAQAPSSAEAAANVISLEDSPDAKVWSATPVSAIGEPVAAVTLASPRWVEANGTTPAYCLIDGAMAPIDTSPHGRAINFRV